MSEIKLKVWILLQLVFFPTYSFPCDDQLSFKDGYNLTFDYERKESNIIGVDGKPYQTKTLSKCGKFAGKYLRLGMAAEIPSPFSTVSGFSYDSQPNLGIYEIKNLIIPFQFPNREVLLNNLLKRQKKIDSCIDITIQDQGNEKLELLEDSQNCQAKSTNEGNFWIIYSGRCGFKINDQSNFKIGIQENTNCLNKEFWRREGLEPGNYSSRLMADVVEPNSENGFKKIKSAGTLILNLNLKSEEGFYKNLNISGNGGKEPVIWILPEIQFKGIKIRKVGEMISRIDLSFLIDNDSCQNICKEGICTSPCNFRSPLSGEIILSEVNNGGELEIANSLIGEALRPNWEGIINIAHPMMLSNVELMFGQIYKLDLKISDPYLGYLQFKKEVKRSLLLTRGAFNLSRGTEISSIADINTDFNIRDIGNVEADFAIGASYENVFSIGDTTLGFSELAEDKEWPPIYSLACNKNYTICKKPETSNLGKLSVVFEIVGEKDGLYEIKVIEMERKSKIINEFKVKGASFPKIISGNQEL